MKKACCTGVWSLVIAAFKVLRWDMFKIGSFKFAIIKFWSYSQGNVNPTKSKFLHHKIDIDNFYLTCQCSFGLEDQGRFVEEFEPGPGLVHPCRRALMPCAEKSNRAGGKCGLKHQILSHSRYPWKNKIFYCNCQKVR